MKSSTVICGLPTSMTKKYDIFLVYDPENDYVHADHVMKIVEEKHKGECMKVLDFAKNQEAGTPPNKFFAKALNICKYTCIIVSRNFFDNMWMQFKVDMAIQDMMQNEHKQYTLIVVVMDISLKLRDLPLDLQTLSPILYSERFFETRISNAFGVSIWSAPCVVIKNIIMKFNQSLNNLDLCCMLIIIPGSPFSSLQPSVNSGGHSSTLEYASSASRRQVPIQETLHPSSPGHNSSNFCASAFHASHYYPSSKDRFSSDSNNARSNETITPEIAISQDNSNRFNSRNSNTPFDSSANCCRKEKSTLPDLVTEGSSEEISNRKMPLSVPSTSTRSMGSRQPTESNDIDDPVNSCTEQLHCSTLPEALPDAESFQHLSQPSKQETTSKQSPSRPPMDHRLDELQSTPLDGRIPSDSMEDIPLEISDDEIPTNSNERSSSIRSFIHKIKKKLK